MCVCVRALTHSVMFDSFVTPRTVAPEALLSMGFSGQEHWSGPTCHPSGDLPSSGIEPVSLASPALAGWFFTTSASWEGLHSHTFENTFHIIMKIGEGIGRVPDN